MHPKQICYLAFFKTSNYILKSDLIFINRFSLQFYKYFHPNLKKKILFEIIGLTHINTTRFYYTFFIKKKKKLFQFTTKPNN